MKTTIEIKGYQIIIDESEETVTVSATKDEEIVEEFTLNLSEGESEESEDESGIKGFGEFGEEEDFESEDESEDEESEDESEDDESEDEDDEDESALESFQSFINKK